MTKIQWTERTWNPIVGCSIKSPGCRDCYAMGMAARLQEMHRAAGGQPHHVGAHYAGLTHRVNGKPVWTGRLAPAPEHIWREPLKVQKPSMWFVNSMGDLFHEACPDEWIDRAVAIMALTPRHTYQILTKRGDVMRKYFAEEWGESTLWRVPQLAAEEFPELVKGSALEKPNWWPLPNVWLGVSVERQDEDYRIQDLLSTAAAVHFVSAEPLLGRLDLSDYMKCPLCKGWGFRMVEGVGRPCMRCVRLAQRFGKHVESGGYAKLKVGLDWVIVGGESGHNARPMDPAWAESIVAQCDAAEVAVFVKQMGARPVGLRLKARKGDDPAEWPEQLRVREMPDAA